MKIDIPNFQGPELAASSYGFMGDTALLPRLTRRRQIEAERSGFAMRT
jgi:hypothetical protein